MNQEKLNPKNIWSVKQNHPELVVQDCIAEFGLTEKEAEKLRFILMKRGINKWLYCRYKFIRLKHKVKELMKDNPDNQEIAYVQEKMQNIAKTPRWIEWPEHVSKKMQNNIKRCMVKGRHC